MSFDSKLILTRRKSKPTCRTLTNIKEFGLATELDRVVIIGFFPNETSQGKVNMELPIHLYRVYNILSNSQNQECIENDFRRCPNKQNE